MELLAEVAIEMCWHIFLEHCNKTEIVTIAVDGARVRWTVCIGTFASRSLKSFGPYIPEWWTVV